jgi:hypothetical protein
VHPLFFWVAPGIGKPAVPLEICRERQINLMDLRMSLVDPTDLRGIPAVVDEAPQSVKAAVVKTGIAWSVTVQGLGR